MHIDQCLLPPCMDGLIRLSTFRQHLNQGNSSIFGNHLVATAADYVISTWPGSL